MKYYFMLLFFLFRFISTAQTIKFNIRGTVKDTAHAKYAYLTTTTQQVTIASPKIFMVMPIVDGNFEFKGTFDLEGNDFQHACIIVEERGNISQEEAASRFKQLTWISGREKNMRIVVLEDLELESESRDQMKDSKIITGAFSKQLDERNVAVRAKNRKLIEFIKTYPDSPISFDTVKEWSDPITDKDKLESNWGLPWELFAQLSERLKNSKEGIALKKRIDALK